MKFNILFVFLSSLCIIVFLLLAMLNKDIIQSQFFTSLSLIACLNTIRLASGENLKSNYKHAEKKRIQIN